ncbi:hypothetical protein ACHAPA_007220 [Fusarium lateritium]
MEAVGVVLGAVALLDPAYKGLRSLWKAYKTASSYGEDFELSLVSLRSQEWIFTTQLQQYEVRWRLEGADVLHGGNQQSLKQAIAAQIESILRVLDKCYEVVRKFDQEDTEEGGSVTGAEEPEIVAQTAPQNARRPIHKLVKAPQRSVIEAKARKYLDRVKRSANVKGNAKSQLSHDAESVGMSEPESVSSPSPRKGLSEEYTIQEQRVDKRIEEAQKRVSRSKLGSWVDHGKQEFEEFVSQLRELNNDLREILPVMNRLRDVFATIRPSDRSPEVWQDTQEVRDELDGRHKALSFVNRAMPEQGLKPIVFAVKVEEDFNELRSRAEEDGIISGLPLTRQPTLFCLMPRPDGSNTRNDFMLTTPVIEGKDNRITNLPHSIADLKGRDEHFDIIGNVEHSVKDRWIYHLQRVEDDDLVSGHDVSTLVEHQGLRAKERICLAADIARSYLYYMEINRGKCLGPLTNYRLFGQNAPATEDANWSLQTLGSLWVEFGFGLSTAPKSSKFRSRTQYQEERISAAMELGVLLYEVTAGKLLEYNPTAEGLQIARKAAQDGLSEVEQHCGILARDVVAACLMDLGNDLKDKDVVEEVAYVLIHYAVRFKKAE